MSGACRVLGPSFAPARESWRVEAEGRVVLCRLICVGILNNLRSKSYCQRTILKTMHCHHHLVCNSDTSSTYFLLGVIIRIYISFILLTYHKSPRKETL